MATVTTGMAAKLPNCITGQTIRPPSGSRLTARKVGSSHAGSSSAAASRHVMANTAAPDAMRARSIQGPNIGVPAVGRLEPVPLADPRRSTARVYGPCPGTEGDLVPVPLGSLARGGLSNRGLGGSIAPSGGATDHS